VYNLNDPTSAHDSFARLLNWLEPDPQTLRDETRLLVRLNEWLLILDDSVLDKPFAQHMDLVGRFWSGRHKRVVKGIDLVSLVWTDGDALYPCDYRLIDPVDAEGKTKNDLFRDMIEQAKARGFKPQCVAFDS
jgi:putative transposase